MATSAESPAAISPASRVLTSAGDVRGKAVLDRDGDKIGTIDEHLPAFDEACGRPVPDCYQLPASAANQLSPSI